jgi:LuxR family transcriptional regulator, maltose regulon positive regulatory protein
MIRPVRPDGTIETGGVFVPIVRRRVVDRIASAAMQRVVLVVAPAGYGKSVALRQYLDTLTEPYLRYDVLAENAGLLGFLRGFADAVSATAPDARTTLAGAYEKNASAASPGADLAMWMHSHLKSYRGVIAIDDLQVAQEDREVTRFLTSLIERTKGRVQWIIASRATLGLPIGTWLAYGESDLAIDEHDLKFSVEEAKEAARAFRLGVRDEELFELLNLTDGWATAMTFALRSSTRSVDLRNIASMTREMIYRYLAEQVYQTLSEEERDFIETAALLPEINLDVMVAAGFDRASALLADLRGRVAFIHEDEAGIFRLHDLFRDFVVHQFDLRGRDAVLRTNAKLARLLEKRGLHVEALRLFVQARQEREVLRILSEHGARLVAQGFADEIAFAVSADLSASYSAAPMILGLRGLIETAHGNFTEADRLISRAVREVEDVRLRAELKLQLAQLRSNRGEKPRELLEEIVCDPGAESAQRLEAESMLASLLARIGENTRALEIFNRISVTPIDGLEESSQARIHLRMGHAAYYSGDHVRGRRCYARASELAAANGVWNVASKAHRALATAAVLVDGDPSMSLVHAQQAVVAAARAGDSSDHLDALLTILGLETRRGSAERAAQIEKQIAELNVNDATRAIYLVSSQAHRKAWSGDYAEAARLFGGILDRQAYFPDRLVVRGAHALCLALAGMSKAAGECITVFNRIMEEQVEGQKISGAATIECALAFSVLSETVSGRLTSAQRMLKRSPLDDGMIPAAMRDGAETLVRRAKSQTFDGSLDSSIGILRERGFGGYARYLEIVAGVVEERRLGDESVTLTPSELRILRYLAAGLSPKEIAAEMDRSVYTVQTHIQNLTEKLGTHGRAGAIAAARRLGIIGGSSINGPT